MTYIIIYNIGNIPATPLNNAHLGGFFLFLRGLSMELTKKFFLHGFIPWYILGIYVPTIVVFGIGRLPSNL